LYVFIDYAAALRTYFGNLHLLKARLARRLILSREPLSRPDSSQGRMSQNRTLPEREMVEGRSVFDQA